MLAVIKQLLELTAFEHSVEENKGVQYFPTMP